MQKYEAFVGFRGFIVIWLGQVISFVGTAMTRFALTIWVYQETGSATALALMTFFSFGPLVLASPVAGALVDRWNRKQIMIVTDLVAGLSTVALLLLFISGNLQIWHLYVAGAVAGAFEAFQFPAFSAAITMMVPKEHYTRASGLLSLAHSTSMIAGPAFAGLLLAFIGIGGVLTIDVVTFLIAIGLLALVYIPQPKATAAADHAPGNLWRDSLYGFQYILQRPSLLGIQIVFSITNMLSWPVFVLMAPLVLARTGNDEVILGTVQSALGVGGVVGGLLLSVWGGPKKRIHGVLIGTALVGLLGKIVFGLSQGIVLWIVGAFMNMFFTPLINGSNQAIWQAKVAPEVQGRVFATRRLIAQLAGPISALAAGPLADRFFEPAMMPAGALAATFGGLVGTGPGAGIALMILILGVLTTLNGVAGYAFPIVRNAETRLPDHPIVAAPPTATADQDKTVAVVAD